MSEPTIRFFRGPTGHRVAYAVHGEGPPLMFSAWWVSHLEEDWKQPGFRKLFGGLAEHFTVYRYDRPGAGLSDRERDRVSVEEEALTLEALCDHLALDRLSIFGLTCAAPPAIALAVKQPERVDKLVLFGAYVKGVDVAPPHVREAITSLVRASWGMGSKMITDLFDPRLDADERKAMSAVQRAAASNEMAAKLLQLTFESDVSELATRVSTPSLVLHRKGDRAIPFDAGRELAATLPNATFHPLEGEQHVPWLGDVDEVQKAVSSFLGVTAQPTVSRDEYALERAGDVWTLTFAGETALLKHARGLSDLAILLASPGREVHCGTLWSGATTAAELGQTDDPVLDERALDTYRQRLRAIDAELEDATGKRERMLHQEREALVKELRAAVGLGGRKRSLDATSERARKAVTSRVRASIKKNTDALPNAGLHLSKHIVTGTYLSYEAPDDLPWVIR